MSQPRRHLIRNERFATNARLLHIHMRSRLQEAMRLLDQVLPVVNAIEGFDVVEAYHLRREGKTIRGSEDAQRHIINMHTEVQARVSMMTDDFTNLLLADMHADLHGLPAKTSAKASSKASVRRDRTRRKTGAKR